MSAPESYKEWFEGFRKEVDAVVSSAAAQPGSDRGARAAFDSWWQTTQEPVTVKGPDAIDEIARKMDCLLYEKAELEKRLEEARAAEDAGKAAQAETKSVRADAERESRRLEARNAALEEQLTAQRQSFEEQTASLKEDRKFLEEALAREEAAKLRGDEDLRLERARGNAETAELLKAKSRAAALEAEQARLREALAAREGTLDELRRQASIYQERLVHAKELTDADVALLRQELRIYLEEMRIMVNTIKKGATT